MNPLSPGKKKAQLLLRQSLGTLKKTNEMIEADQYCPEIIQQVDSVIGLLKSAKRELLAGHLDTCLVRKLKENKAEAIKELLKIFNLSS